MALEQTILRSYKSTEGIIGKTKSKEYVSEWALVSHEVLSIARTLGNTTRADKEEHFFREALPPNPPIGGFAL